MSEPRTATGKRLADWGVEDIALVEAEATAMERKRLRAEHRTWDGHPSRGYSCGVCDELLAPVKAAKEASDDPREQDGWDDPHRLCGDVCIAERIVVGRVPPFEDAT